MTPLDILLVAMVVGLSLALWRQTVVADEARKAARLSDIRCKNAEARAKELADKILGDHPDIAGFRRRDRVGYHHNVVMADGPNGVPRVGKTAEPRMMDKARCGLMGDPHLCQDGDGTLYRTDTGQGVTHDGVVTMGADVQKDGVEFSSMVVTPKAYPGG